MFKRDFFICLLLIVGITSNAVAQTTYIHTNAQGSVIAKSDTSGNITARYHYQPFGKRLENSDFSGTGFTGHQRDNDLGLTYMQARYYDETLGRFYSNDPVGYTDKNPVMSFNRYLYVNNNPYKYDDPSGKFAFLLAFTPEIAALAKAAFVVGSAGVAGYAGSEAINAYNESAERELDFDKVNENGQLGERGWTEGEVTDLVNNTDPSGKTVDKRSPSKTSDGKGRNDPASVYGSKQGGHVVVNDNTGEVVQVSDKNDANWIPDSRIEWTEEKQ